MPEVRQITPEVVQERSSGTVARAIKGFNQHVRIDTACVPIQRTTRIEMRLFELEASQPIAFPTESPVTRYSQYMVH